MPASQVETQVHSNKHKHKSKSKHKKRDSRGSSSQHSHRHSQRGVLSDTAAQNRQNRRVENSASMSGGAGKRTGSRTLEKQLQAQIAKLKAQIDEREKTYLEELAQVRKSAPKSKRRKHNHGGYATSVPVSTELDERVADVAGSELWRTCKFLADEDQLDQACELVMAEIPEVAGLVEEDNDDREMNIQAFKEHYGETICKVINVKRGDVQSGLKKAYEARVAAGLSVPTPSQLGKVIRRVGLDFDPEDPDKNAEQREWFLWYWEHLLSKVGGKATWGHTIRCYGTISKHAPPDNPKKKYITSSDEALVLVLYENCGQRFPYTAECMAAGTKPDQNHVRYQSRWSNARAGQCKWGGWNLDGRVRYIELRDKISGIKRKHQERVARVEAQALADLQAKYKIGQGQSAKKKGAKLLDFEGKDEGKASFGVESDDETQGDDDGGSDFEELGEEYQEPPK